MTSRQGEAVSPEAPSTSLATPPGSAPRPAEGDEQVPPYVGRLHVVGAGLIGTSVGLAAAVAGWRVTVEDADEGSAERARRRIDAVSLPGLDAGLGPHEVDLVCVAVPPAAVGESVARAARLHLGAILIDVASVKAQPERDVETSMPGFDRFVPTHPLGGGEGSGPDAARGDLFRGRSWVVCASPVDVAERAPVVLALIEACGARPVWLPAAEHDRLLAVTSHLPQLLASALAAEVEAAFGNPPLEAADPPDASPSDAGLDVRVPVSSLAGPALWDMTRVAASPSELWAQVAHLNYAHLRRALRSLLTRLDAVEAGMTGPAESADQVAALVDVGRAARTRLGRKHRGAAAAPDGSRAAAWTWVDVAIDDTPGTLARVFATAGRLGVNVEDVRVDHAPYASQGTVSVAVLRPADAGRLQEALRSLDGDPTAPRAPDA